LIFNAEYRFKLFKVSSFDLEGALFGFRMDFEYFKLALDLGYRVRNPFPNPAGSYWAYDRWRELGLKGINYNLAVGYPF